MYNYNRELWGRRKPRKRHLRPAPPNIRSLPVKMVNYKGHPYDKMIAKVTNSHKGQVALYIPYDETQGVTVITTEDNIKELW